MNWKNKKVFISGGNGVIGNELVQLLFNQGAKIFIGDLKPRPIDLPASIQYWQGDLNYITNQEIASFGPEIFFHLAATFERSTETYEFWEENYHHNLRLSHHLTTMMKDLPSLQQIIFASSYLIYEPQLYSQNQPPERPFSLKEDSQIYPRNLTGVAKLNHEIELRFIDEFRSQQISSCSVRIYRSFGLNSRDIISRWVRSLLAGESITLWGEQSYFDYIFARDVAKGLMKLAEVKNKPMVVNLGTGRSRRVSDVIDVLKKHFPKANIQTKDFAGPYENSQADVSLLKDLTGWIPEDSIESAIPQIIQFEKSRSKKNELKGHSNVLITSVSKKVPLIEAVKTAQKKLGAGKVFGGDTNSQCLSSFFVDSFWVMPKLKDLTISHVIDYCNQNEISIIVPSRDAELKFWAENRNELAKHSIKVMISKPESIDVCYDKLKFFEFCRSHDLPVISTLSDISTVTSDSGRWVVKERFGAGSNQIKINVSYEEAILYAKGLSSPIFQPYVEGKEISADAYYSEKGKCVGLVMRTRDKIQESESQVTTTFRDDQLEEKLKAILANFEFTGHVIAQLFVTSEGLKLIEINPRFGGASTASLAAGLDSFYWFLLEANGQSAKDLSYFRLNSEVKQIRYPKDKLIYGPNF